VQPFVRYEYLQTNPDDPALENDFHFITTGWNYFLYRHAAKFTIDVLWALQGPPANAAMIMPYGADAGSTGLGLIGDSPDGDPEVAVRAQFQLLF